MVSRRKRTSPIRRSVLLPLSFGLAVLTAVSLLWLATSVRTASSIRADGGAEYGNQLAVRQFYGTVNRVLRGGDGAALARAFAPELLTPAAAAGTPSPVDALVGRLTAVRDAYPDLHYTVETLVADGDFVIAQIAARATRRRSGRGLAIDGPPLVWSGTDRFRFVDGLIVEYRAGWETIVAKDAGWTVTVNHPPDGPTLVAVVRFIFAAGTRLPAVAAPGPVLYVVESGRLLAESSATAPEMPSTPGTPPAAGRSQNPGDHVRAGNPLIVPAGVSVELENDGPTAAVVLGVVLFPFAPVPHDEARASQTVADRVLSMYVPAGGAAPEVAWPSGLTVRGLAATVIDGPGPHPLVVAGDPIVLAPGEAIGTHRVGDVEFVTVDAGSAGLVVTSPELHVSRASENVRPSNPGVVDESGPADGKAFALSTGDSAAIVGGTVQAERNVGGAPLSVLVLTITPADDPQ
jgi:predicted ester cyclase